MMAKTAVVTGASAGVGRAVVRELASRGYQLGLIARGHAGLEAAAEDARRLGGGRALTFPVDVTDSGAVFEAADRVHDELGSIDVWINNAMVSVFASAWDITPQEYQRVIDVNYLGTVYGSLAALRYMRPRGEGTIVQVGSALAYRGIPLQAPYCASKHAIQGFVDSLRSELLADGNRVRVSMVQLPAVNTPQFSWVRTRLPRHPQPVPPIYQPEVAAKAVVWAGEHGPRELGVGGFTVLSEFVNKIVPGAFDRYLSKTGFVSQQTADTIDRSQWTDNVDEPVDENIDYGAHGEFDDTSKRRSPQLWARLHRGELVGVAGAASLVALGAVLRTRRRARLA